MSAIELSVVIPFCDEGGNIIFTTQAMIEELDGFCKYEIILVDNMSHDHLVTKAGDREYPTYSRNYFASTGKDRTISTMFFRKGIVRYLQYDLKQGHWNAKNHGIQNSTGKYILFLDAHCIMKRDSVRKMVQFLRDWEGKEYDHPMTPDKKWKVGAVHAYINYILDSRCLEYKPQKKTFGYQFCTHQVDEYFLDAQKKEVEVSEQIRLVTRAAANPPDSRKQESWESKYGNNPIVKPYLNEHGVILDPSWPKRLTRFKREPYQVCVMSTCAMMCPRSLINELGMWNPEYGCYGGGESGMVWKQCICGYGHFIHPEAWCWHFADKRGYSWNHSDFVRNSFIAAYTVGGEPFLQQQVDLRLQKERPAVIQALAEDVRNKCKAEMAFIQSKQIVDFETYITWYLEHPGVWR